ncbi:MAG: ABC transporter permease [Bacteroidales bacterium]|jgi:putative ABC transport system permease protein|nr:ABC transporter permease [Bacteroidales bacterium]
MKDLFTEIWSSLRQNKLRTTLTGLAVSWGIIIIIVLLGTGNGLMNALLSNSGDTVLNLIEVYPGITSRAYNGMKEGTPMRFNERDIAFSEQFSGKIDRAFGALYFSDTLSLGRETLSSNIEGVAPLVKDTYNIRLAAGRFINENDLKNNSKIIVIDSNAASQLLGDAKDYTRIIGQDIVVGNIPFKVVGIHETEEMTWGHDSYIPYSTARIMRTDGAWLGRITLHFHGLESKAANEEFEHRYKRAMNTFHGADPEDTRTTYLMNRYLNNQEMSKGIRIMRTALWILGFLTLLSGIVGVSNIMLITVKERIHEFGIRKALGATPWSILKLIVMESIFITAFFGYIGMVVGMGADIFLDKTLAAHPMDMGIIQLYVFKNIGVGFDVAIKATLLLIVAGTIAGIIPAWQGAKVRPIEALRADK